MKSGSHTTPELFLWPWLWLLTGTLTFSVSGFAFEQLRKVLLSFQSVLNLSGLLGSFVSNFIPFSSENINCAVRIHLLIKDWLCARCVVCLDEHHMEVPLCWSLLASTSLIRSPSYLIMKLYVQWYACTHGGPRLITRVSKRSLFIEVEPQLNPEFINTAGLAGQIGLRIPDSSFHV